MGGGGFTENSKKFFLIFEKFPCKKFGYKISKKIDCPLPLIGIGFFYKKTIPFQKKQKSPPPQWAPPPFFLLGIQTKEKKK